MLGNYTLGHFALGLRDSGRGLVSTPPSGSFIVSHPFEILYFVFKNVLEQCVQTFVIKVSKNNFERRCSNYNNFLSGIFEPSSEIFDS